MPDSGPDPSPKKVIFDKYELGRLLGRGGFAKVYHARNLATNQSVAVKIIPKSRISKANLAGHVTREVAILRRLRHPHIVRLHEVLASRSKIYFVLEFAKGGELFARVEKLGRLPEHLARKYFQQLISAVGYCHSRGVFHRDLKPENILIQESGHIMLVDFDLSAKLPAKISSFSPPGPTRTKKPDPAKKSRRLFPCFSFNSGVSPEVSDSTRNPSVSSEASGKSNSFVGTEEYVAPEIIKGGGHDYAVDWWSLGIVLYEMLYGRTPFRGQNRKETFYRILNMNVNLVGEKTALRDLIGRLLEKEAEKRIGAEEIKRHEFFGGVNWEEVLTVERTPFIPLGVDWEEGESLDVERCVEEVFRGGEGNKGEGEDGVRKFPQNEDFSVF